MGNSEFSREMQKAILWILWSMWKNRNATILSARKEDIDMLARKAVEDSQTWIKVNIAANVLDGHPSQCLHQRGK